MVRYSIVKLGGVDVSSDVRYHTWTSNYGEAISTIEISVVRSIADTVTLDNSLSVEVWCDENLTPTKKIFSGFLDNYVPDGAFITLNARDKLVRLVNREVTHIYDKNIVGDPAYPSGKLSAVFKDIVETYGDLSTNSGATVQDSGTDITITQFVCANADPFERCRKLADALLWTFYYSADTDYVYFEPKNFTINANTLTVGDNVIKVPTWESDKTELVNSITVKGALQLVETSEVFTGTNSANQVLTMANNFENVALYYSAAKNYTTTSYVNSEKKIGDLTGSLSTHDYEFDTKNKTITLTGFNAAASANNLLAVYSYYAPVNVQMDEPGSIDDYEAHEKTFTLSDVLTFEDAWKRAENILSKYSQPFLTGKINVLWDASYGLKVGQQVHVVDSVNVPAIDKNLTILEIKDKWPSNILELKVGEKQFTLDEFNSNTIERLKRLEESLTSSGGGYTVIKKPAVSFGIAPDTQVFTLDLVNDSWIANDAINGALYDVGEVAVLEDFEVTTGWVSSGIVQTLSVNSTAGQFVVGAAGLKSTWSTVGTASLTKTISTADLSLVTGASTGTPIIGTIGVWVYAASGASVSSIKIKIGSDLNNYATYTASTFAQRNSLLTAFTLQDGLNYLLFDLNVPDSVTGTPNWVSTAYAKFDFVTTAGSDLTFDYLTASKSNYIGVNGWGERVTNWTTLTYTY